MRRLLITGLALSILAPSVALAIEVLDIDQSRYVNAPGFLGYVPDRFIVILKSDVAVDHGRDARAAVALSNLPGFDELAGKYQVQRLRPQFPGADRGAASLSDQATTLARHYKVTIEQGTLEEAMADYAALPDVERVEPIGIHTLYATPNDTYYDDPPPTFPYDQWHYWDTYGVEADLAWDDETGSQAVLVGDLDIGCKYDHGDLGGSNPPGPNDASTDGNIWINSNEIPGNGVDDDGNGYVDDIIGWDFVERTDWYIYSCTDLDCGGADNDPSDGDGHGTHTAGTIAAITNNGYAVAGVAGGYGNGTFSGGGNGVKVVPCRIGYRLRYFGQDLGVVIMDYVAEAMYYMAELKIAGWNVAAINCSFGSSNSGGLSGACSYLIAQDVMVIVAAGNSNSSSPDYLGSRTDCMDVGATDQNGNPASFSNYGTWVDVAAPGVAVMSTMTDPTNPTVDYVAVMDGTSMACPHVVGVAALLESYNPSLSAQDKWNLIVNNSKPYNKTKNVGAGIVDARACLDALGPVCDLAADFSGSPTSGCAPMAVNFTDLSTGTGIDGWSWIFGDGGTSTTQDPSYTYTSAGTYTVSLTVSSSSQGCNDTQTRTGYITVNAGPTAGFVGSPTSGTAPLTVNFTDQSTDATGWSWTFGDGGTSALQNPSHTYTSAGTYTVTLAATNACGSDVEQKVDYITVSPCVAPVADFSGSPTTGVVPLTVNFTDLSSGNPASWSWTFGDGGTSSQQNPSHAYVVAGVYTVSMTATNSCGSDGVTKTDYVTVTEPQAARAYATADVSVLGTYTGSFTDTYISDNVRETVAEALSTSHPRKVTSEAEHKWTFNVAGGGSNYTFYVEAYRSANTEGDDFTFAYSADDVSYTSLVTVASTTEQVYSVALPSLSGTVYIRVTDADRSWGNTQLDAIHIDEMYIEYETTPGPPVAEFAGSPTSGPAPLAVSFTDLSSGSPSSWAWTFGDGGTSTAQNPSHTYNANGTYTVSLTVTNAYGSDEETKAGYIAVADQSTAMHVHNMVVGRAKVTAYYYGTCTVTIRDGNNFAVPGAVVYVTASGPTGGDYSGLTSADGTVTFQTAAGQKKPAGEWCFEVTNVTQFGWTYDSGANDVTRACESGWVYGSGGGDMARLDEPLPSEYGLAQNQPNPFNPATAIRFTLAGAGHVTLEVFNIAGQRVAALVDGVYPAGEFSVSWDASGYSSGIYLYRLTTGDFVQTRKMVLLK